MHATEPGRAWHRLLEPVCESIGKPRGYIAGDFPSGLVKVEGVPAAREVRLFHRATGVLIGITFSRADGTYRFEDLPVSERYDVIARDHAGAFCDVIASNVVPWFDIDRAPHELLIIPGVGELDFSANLSWDLFDGLADEVRIYRSPVPFNMASLPPPIATLTGSAVTYRDASGSEGQWFHYMVASVYADGVYYSDAKSYQIKAGISIYENAVLELGPLSYWRLDDEYTTAADAAGFHDAFIVGSVVDGPPLRNGAVKSLGFGIDAPSTAKVVAGADPRYSGLVAFGRSMTIAMWVHITAYTTYDQIIAYFTNANAGYTNYRLIYGSSFQVGGGSANLASKLSIGQTYFLVMRSSPEGLAFFVNGSLAASNPNAYSSTGTGGEGLMFPAAASWDYYGMRGYMSDVAIFEHALSNTEILDLWSIGAIP